MDRIFLTPEQAIALIGKRKQVHTFRNPNGMLIGADWSGKALIAALKKAGKDQIEIGGDSCKSMGHGLILWSNGPLFIEVDKEAIEKLEAELTV